MELVKYNEESKQLEISENVIAILKDYQKKKAEFEIKEKKFKEELLEAMEKYNITSWSTPNNDIDIVYKKATKRTTIDSTRLKKELPDIAEEYSKTTDVKSSIAISINV